MLNVLIRLWLARRQRKVFELSTIVYRVELGCWGLPMGPGPGAYDSKKHETKTLYFFTS